MSKATKTVSLDVEVVAAIEKRVGADSREFSAWVNNALLKALGKGGKQ